MALLDIELPLPRADELPERVRALIREADQRTQAFVARRTIPGFVLSDFERVGRALQAVKEAGLASGDACCEWGSGFGVVALMAACLGFRACGIEINEDLVDEATALAADFELDVEFACGTYVPHGGEDLTDACEEFDWLSAGGACGYDALAADPADFDLIFAYPWPGEEHVIDGLFERYGAVSALLLTYHGGREDIRLRRKVADGSPGP
jgi:hypothetical protein